MEILDQYKVTYRRNKNQRSFNCRLMWHIR